MKFQIPLYSVISEFWPPPRVDKNVSPVTSLLFPPAIPQTCDLIGQKLDSFCSASSFATDGFVLIRARCSFCGFNSCKI